MPITATTTTLPMHRLQAEVRDAVITEWGCTSDTAPTIVSSTSATIVADYMGYRLRINRNMARLSIARTLGSPTNATARVVDRVTDRKSNRHSH